MSQRYTVMALDRRSIGHPNYFRAGRSWPSGEEVEVEVLDQADDPMETLEVKGGEPRSFPHPTKIGRDSWAKLVADKQLIKQPVGATVNEALVLQAAYDATKAELGRTVTRAEMAEEALAQRNAGMDNALKQLAEAREERDRAHEAHFEIVEQLKAKVAELEGQIEQLTAPAVKAEGDAPAAAITQPKGQAKGSTKRGG